MGKTNKFFKQVAILLSFSFGLALPSLADETFSANQAVSDFFISGDYNRNIWDPDGGGFFGTPLAGEDVLKRHKDNGYRIRGSSSYQSASGFGIQFDGVYTDKDIGAHEFTTVDLASHVYFRNDKFLIGVFGQYRHPTLTHNFPNIYGGPNILDIIVDVLADELAKISTPEQTFWGLETQGYFGDFTLNAQAGAQIFMNQHKPLGIADKALDHGYFATLGGTYFIGDNWKFDATVSHNSVRLNGDGLLGGALGLNNRLKQTNFALSTEARIPNTPMSFFARAERTNLDTGAGLDMNNDQITLGLKMSFGGAETLKAQNRSGASLNPVTMDPIGSVMMGNLFNVVNDNYNNLE